MIQALQAYLQRVKSIGDNPFWVTQRSRAARTPWLKSLWRGFAGYSLLFMLPLGLATHHLCMNGALCSKQDRETLVALLATVGVLQLLYLGVKACLSTAPSVVQARQQGTLLALALTRINSADFADGVALAESRTLIREFAVWTPALVLVALLSGQTLYAVAMLSAISALVIVYFSYCGILISATSKDTQEAGRRASQTAFVTLGGSCLGFLCGGFVLGPVWILHPVFAFLCSMFGAGTPYGAALDTEQAFLFWCGWAVFVIPVYLWMILSVRTSAIRSLERVRLT